MIFLTSKDEEIDEVLGLRMGADDFIRKPFSQRLLLERIRAVLRRGDAGSAEARGPQAERSSCAASWCSIRAATSAPGRARRCTSRSPSSCS